VFVQFDEQTHTTRWRHHVPDYPDYGFSGEWNLWHRQDELTAFRYELLRRTSASELPEYPLLPAWLHPFVTGVLSPKPGRSVCAMFHPVTPEGYSSVPWMWDLTASDDALCKHFLGRINDERLKHGLPVTNNPFRDGPGKEKRRGERNRPVSWLAVEAHDIMEYKVRPLSAGERSSLSVARREVAKFEGPLANAIEQTNRLVPLKQRDTTPGNIYSKLIQENFERLLARKLPAD
jgi:hypothetical protein